ncbi:hypothetical protein [Rhizobium mesosinicum]|uniref:Ubiquitin-activating enzyme E1 FCCH domain-containing protein n=1 Tax=Rhizobium mesosinicum TaxID=335017 RepID=A0ABS7GZB5_9HYPH|nr:hypothetical protein [Rhizobium mesosinicum]MBW9054881.1 hypothetical protein [Rhizobium mesosinicum]
MADFRAYQPSFTAGELSPALGARVDLTKYQSGLRTALNVFVHPHGGVSNRAGLQFIHEIKDSSKQGRLIRFQFNTEQTYILEFGHQYIRIFRDGGLVLSGAAPYEVVTAYTADDVQDLVFVQEADVLYLCHVNHPVRKLGRLADNNWTLTTVQFKPLINPPAGTPVVTKPGDTLGKPGYVATTYRYRVSAVADSGEESLPSNAGAVVNDLAIQGGINRVTWAAVSGAARYIVYRDDNGIFGYVGGTTGLSFDDENITPDLSDTPQSGRNPFNAAGNYPRCVTFIEQRLAFASTLNDPQAVWLSQSANYENFGVSSPAKASDAVTFRIRARQVNEIRSMISVRGLLLLTSGSEWIVTGGSAADAISPSAIKLDNLGYRGAARVQPIVVGNTVLFAQRLGGVVRDFSYDYTQDSYVGKDLTILARHLFKGREISAWDYAQAPDSVVWVVLDDGTLVSLTYMKEQDVWAWTRHESGADAFFEDVTVIEENGEDVPYFIVRRTINGQSKRYIERLHSRAFEDVRDAFFVDCGLTYSGPPATTISGLGHLEGQSVVALADGNVVRNLTVTNGAVRLQNAAAKIHIGLPVTAAIQTLDLDVGQVQGLGTVQGRSKSVSEVTFRVENTRGIFTGPADGERDGNVLVEYKQRRNENWNEAISLYTGDLTITPYWDWNTSGAMWVKQFDPLPMTILSIMPDVTLGR